MTAAQALVVDALARKLARWLIAQRIRRSFQVARDAVEAAVVAEALKRGGSQQVAARLLGVSQGTVSRKAERYEL